MKGTKNFGDLLREHRKGKNITLGAMAGILGMPATNLSDIELSRRSPLRIDAIERCAKVLELDDRQVDELVSAACLYRGAVELPLDTNNPSAVEFSAALSREWPSLTADQYRRLSEIVREGDKKKPGK